jgi:hypothetical protein
MRYRSEALIGLVSLGAVVSGCVTGREPLTTLEATWPPKRDVVVVLPNRMGGATAEDTRFAGCVERRVQSLRPEQRIVSAAAFRDALFPWFEPGQIPDTPSDLQGLLARPRVQERLADLGIRYVLAIAGATRNDGDVGAVLCSAHGCLGLMWWDRQTDVVAIVWDLRDVAKADLRVTSAGTAILPAFVLPVPFVPLTETRACDQIGQRLGEVLWR